MSTLLANIFIFFPFMYLLSDCTNLPIQKLNKYRAYFLKTLLEIKILLSVFDNKT